MEENRLDLPNSVVRTKIHEQRVESEKRPQSAKLFGKGKGKIIVFSPEFIQLRIRRF